MKEGYKLQSINRRDSDQKYLEAQEILDQIEMGVITMSDISNKVRIKINKHLLSIYEPQKQICPIPEVTLPLNQRLFLPNGLSIMAEKVDTRARGRAASLKIENTSTGQSWRYGTFRADVQPDGRR